jgi:hypothetical protein
LRYTAPWKLALSSRYHSSLAAAWSGAALSIYERNDKLRGIREELGAERCLTLSAGPEIVRALRDARTIDRTILQDCATRAGQMLHEVFFGR